MCGEWQSTHNLGYAFASYHRLFRTCKMIGKLEIITGAAALIAEYNCVENVSHVRNKLAWMPRPRSPRTAIGAIRRSGLKSKNTRAPKTAFPRRTGCA